MRPPTHPLLQQVIPINTCPYGISVCHGPFLIPRSLSMIGDILAVLGKHITGNQYQQ